MTELEELVAKAANGDSAAYTQLYKMSRRQVYFTCLGFVKNETDAEDLMQETFFTVLMKLQTLSDGNNFQAWVNRIAINKCKNFLARRSAVPYEEEPVEDGNDPADEEITLPDEYVVNEEKRKIIMDIIMTKLSDVQRQTVIMYYYDEMTAAEISQEMGCPIGTVTYLLSAARKAMEKEILRYEKISGDRLHSVLPVPFLTSLLRAEAEKLHIPNTDFSPFISSAANISAAAASSGETIHSIGSKIVAAATAIVFSGSAAVYYVNRHEYDIDTSPGYEYYELLNEEYEKSSCVNNSSVCWYDEDVYFTNSDTDDFFRYDPEENALDLIIPSSCDVSLEIDGKMTDCTVDTWSRKYCYDGNIFCIGYLTYDDTRSQEECALIKYDMDGNIEDNIILEDFYHGYDTFEACEETEIDVITDDGMIYFSCVEIRFTNAYTPGTITRMTYCRINTDFKDLEKNLDLTNNNDDYYCSSLDYCSGRLYASCNKKGDYMFTQEDFLTKTVCYAYDEETLELIEDDFFTSNDIKPIYSIGKYMVTADAVYDTDTNEILVNIPMYPVDGNALFYYGGGYHFYFCDSEERNFEIRRVRLPGNISYENAKETVDSLEYEEVIINNNQSRNFEILDSDTYLIYELEGTYFCRISAGERTKLQFPWSEQSET